MLLSRDVLTTLFCSLFITTNIKIRKIQQKKKKKNEKKRKYENRF